MSPATVATTESPAARIDCTVVRGFGVTSGSSGSLTGNGRAVLFTSIGMPVTTTLGRSGVASCRSSQSACSGSTVPVIPVSTTTTRTTGAAWW